MLLFPYVNDCQDVSVCWHNRDGSNRCGSPCNRTVFPNAGERQSSQSVGITGTEVIGAAVHVTGQFFLMLGKGNLASSGWLALCSNWLYNGG